ncbi:MAG: flavin reductase [Clostridiaceae bacterium]|jgi:flavin reductase (DIM6/NTAB) family NADH-FMN oxidoreductase RutF/rubredoxin|nr:flavin reductase [Clostridiaceae bacterium]
MDIKALKNISCGLYLITSHVGNHYNGCIANTLLQVTSTPIKLSVTLNKKNATCEYIKRSGHFTATVVSEASDIVGPVALFGFFSGHDRDKFANDPEGNPTMGCALDKLENKYVTDGMSTVFSVRVTSALDIDTHIMFVGELIDAKILNDEAPMTYDYYRNVKNGTTPPRASSYALDGVDAKAPQSGGEEPVVPKVKRWRCSKCGHIYDGNTIPDGYVCPTCQADKTFFNIL